MLNYRGEAITLCDIFEQTVHKTPPAGAGECAAPKLLQQAYLHHWKPIAMAEFWWGNSPKTKYGITVTTIQPVRANANQFSGTCYRDWR